MTNRRIELLVCAGLMALAGSAVGQDAVKPLDTLAPLTVVGSVENVWNLAGSAAYVDAEEFRERGYTDIASVLAKVPGVYVRQEDGYGNFPNISMRGADGTRTEKVTVMEDGILTAPAPYSAPAAYYFPKVARMSAVEVLKGSSQVRYGPQTTGGVLNFLSTEVPVDSNFYSRTTGGSDSTFSNHTWYGDTVEVEGGRFGYVLEFHGQQTDGYRKYLGGLDRDSGFQLWEPMFKAFWELDGPVRQRFEFKIGHTDFESDEGYLGLSEADARFNPDARYVASAFDHMDTEQTRSYFKYLVEPSDSFSLESALYWNQFERNWYKLDHVSTTLNPGIDGRGRISGGSGRTSLNAALLNPGLLAVLQGSAPGSIGVKANARYYDAYGWQNQATWLFDTGAVQHELTAGLRLHYDRVFREQWVDVFNANGDGTFTSISRGTPGDESNALEEAFATSLFVEDVVKIGQLTLRPGVRYEHVELAATNFNGGGLKMSDDLDVWAGGIGANYEFNDCHSMYGGIYRGVSLPGPSSFMGGVDIEESLGYELGWRYRNGGLTLDTAAFFTDFENLIGVDAGLAGGVNQNAGKAETWGVESLIAYDPAVDRGWAYGLPMYVSATWTSAELKQALTTGGADDIYAGGQPGADIPYVPEWKLAAGIGFEAERWGVNLDALFLSHTYGTALNSPVPVTTARQGKIDAVLTVDLTGNYKINDHVKLVGGLHNLFDERAVVTRLPEGPRTNLPRTWFAGVEATF